MFARIEKGVTKFSTKKKKTPQFWIRNSSFQCWGICFFLAAETHFGGDNFKTA